MTRETFDRLKVQLYDSLETTEDIINAIISVYNKNNRDHDLSFLQENSTEKNMSFYSNLIFDSKYKPKF